MDDLRLRPAGTADLPALAELFLRARAAAVPAMPPGTHSDAEVQPVAKSSSNAPSPPLTCRPPAGT